MTAQRRRRRARGGQGGWEPPARIREREQRAVTLAVQGWTQHDIARDLGVTQAAVSKILARADQRALAELGEAVERQKVRHTQRLEHLYAETVRAWERSKGDATRRRQRQTDAGTSGRGGQHIAEVTVESQHGDARYLEEGRRILADLRRVWGIDAPQRLDVRASRSPLDQLSDAELVERLTQQDRLLHQAGVVIDVRPVRPSTEPA